MRTIIIGLGNQGRKRAAVAGSDVVATVDPIAQDASHRSLSDLPAGSYDAALVCTPDDAKLPILRQLLSEGKRVLVEKPLVAADPREILDIAQLAHRTGATCYTAYNHRFEPGVARLQGLLARKALGRVYHARFFYGNGTTQNVRESPWRDRNLGVLQDLGSHLLDLAFLLFGDLPGPFRCEAAHRFENHALDHVTFSTASPTRLAFEASLVSWKNTFTVDVVGAAGSAHLQGLRKWGTSTLTVRKRVFPSGAPEESVETFEGDDDTWAREYEAFRAMGPESSTLEKDAWILERLLQTANGGATP